MNTRVPKRCFSADRKEGFQLELRNSLNHDSARKYLYNVLVLNTTTSKFKLNLTFISIKAYIQHDKIHFVNNT
jgi:hypothetical protein